MSDVSESRTEGVIWPLVRSLFVPVGITFTFATVVGQLAWGNFHGSLIFGAITAMLAPFVAFAVVAFGSGVSTLRTGGDGS